MPPSHPRPPASSGGLAFPTNADDLGRRLWASLIDVVQPRREAGPEEQDRLHQARSGLIPFTQYTFPGYKVNWHHRLMGEHLDAFARGEITRLITMMPPQHGKAAKIDTPIPTPGGWIAIGKLRVGDHVFAGDGTVTRVVAVSPVWRDRPVYEVTTDTGLSVVVDAEHEWAVRLCRKHKNVCLHTTEDLARRHETMRCFRAPLVACHPGLDLPEVPLPIPPYTLGAWLGDGCSWHGSITKYPRDQEHYLARFATDGFAARLHGNKKAIGILGLETMLRRAGLLRNKHIPHAYLRAGRSQRIALLNGLIDTDGHVAPDGQVEFCSVRRELAEGVQELLATLGVKSSLLVGRSVLNGTDHGPKYRVMFYFAQAASLPRKAKYCRSAARKPGHYLTIKPAGVADTVCIQVEHPSHLFLTGPGMVPTHNSELVSRRLPAKILGDSPDLRLMACSYGDSLASLMNRDVQRIMDSDSYKALYPQTRLMGRNVRTLAYGNYLRNNSIFEVVGRRGAYVSAGVGGSITGKPFHRGIIDDPIKDDEEARSPTIRDKIWNWYITTFYERKTDFSAGILVNTTRWDEDDLVGRLLDNRDPKADKWVVLRFPAILETEAQRMPGDPRGIGEALWPERHPIGELEAKRAQTSAYYWSCVNQQDPTPSSGTVFLRKHFRYFADQVDDEGRRWFALADPAGPRLYRATDCLWFQCIDTAMVVNAGAAYTCVGTFCRTPAADLLIFHVWRVRLEIPYQYRSVKELRVGLGRWDPETNAWEIPGSFNPWPAPILYQAIESKASGIEILQTAAAEGYPLRELKASGHGKGGKMGRAVSAVALYERGKVYHRAGSDWLATLEKELIAGPAGKYMDQFDVVAYAGIQMVKDTLLNQGVAEDHPVIAPPDKGRNGYDEPGKETFTVGTVDVTFSDMEDDWHAG